ncbi:hypothetical protein OCU04_012359 [Sclerotinia nivalis]|uniref:ABM domain-containing protein n=1 Tax=Sclerotinia nivalis TaxID=352851 RepID=A0A9X0AB22_9HELO|nr:hypothetical protein OCU04_012359 [Sclerotinia nivalis]
MISINGSEDGPVTEIVRMKLRGGIRVGDLEGEGEYARIWRETLDTVASQKGYTDSSYGAVIEEKEDEVLVWCIDWTSLAHHKSFMDSPAYPSFLENLKPIMESPEIIHVEKLNVKGVIGKGVMEVTTFFDVEDILIEGMKKFITAVQNLHTENKIAGYLGVVNYGEVIGKIARNGDAKEEEKGRGLVFIVGWENLAAHMAFQKTQDFRDTTEHLSKGSSGFEMFHTALKSS